jgi:hypothetical protein
VTSTRRPIEYKGEPLDAERGPGLGCFRFQLVVLAVLVVLTPLSVAWRWPGWLSTGLLFAVIVLLLIAGQTIIFLLRLVAADRRSRRRPLASATRTVGDLEDERRAGPVGDEASPGERPSTMGPEAPPPETPEPPPPDEGPVRQ